MITFTFLGVPSFSIVLFPTKGSSLPVPLAVAEARGITSMGLARNPIGTHATKL